jgi:hypothetical protein
MCIYKYKYIYILKVNNMALYILGRRAKVLGTEELFSDLSKIALACTGKHPSTAHPIHHTIIPALPCLNSPRRI